MCFSAPRPARQEIVVLAPEALPCFLSVPKQPHSSPHYVHISSLVILRGGFCTDVLSAEVLDSYQESGLQLYSLTARKALAQFKGEATPVAADIQLPPVTPSSTRWSPCSTWSSPTSDRIPQYPTTLPPPLAICIKYSSSKHSSSNRGWEKLIKGGKGTIHIEHDDHHGEANLRMMIW